MSTENLLGDYAQWNLKQDEIIKSVNANRGKGEKKQFDPDKYCGLKKNSDSIVRILGRPFHNRKKGSDNKLVLVSKIVNDTKDGYVTMYWPTVLESGKFIPDPNFILTKLLDKVRESKWVKYTDSDLKNIPGLHKGVDGKIVNEKGHDGYYQRLHEDLACFQRIKINTTAYSKFPPSFYPKPRILLNVIDRMDTWCGDNKKAKILCIKKDDYTNKQGEKRFNLEVGIIQELYNKVVSLHLKGVGDWEKIDTVIQKSYREENGRTNVTYEVCDATEDRRFIDAKTKDIVSKAVLTEEEKGYELVDFDKNYKLSYYLIHRNLKGLFKLVDSELNTTFTEELEHLLIKEKEERGNGNGKGVDGHGDGEAEAIFEEEGNGGSSEVVQEKEAPPQKTAPVRETINVLEVIPQVREVPPSNYAEVFPAYNQLSDDDKKILEVSLEKVDAGIPIWKKATSDGKRVTIALCFKANSCMFKDGKTKTVFPNDMTQCPICGAKS